MTVDNLMQLQLECTLFFQENPYTMETRDGIALRLGRDSGQLDAILERLVSLCILEKLGDGSRSIYRYNQPEIASGSGPLWSS
jgi:hypothetical protein